MFSSSLVWHRQYIFLGTGAYCFQCKRPCLKNYVWHILDNEVVLKSHTSTEAIHFAALMNTSRHFSLDILLVSVVKQTYPFILRKHWAFGDNFDIFHFCLYSHTEILVAWSIIPTFRYQKCTRLIFQVQVLILKAMSPCVLKLYSLCHMRLVQFCYRG